MLLISGKGAFWTITVCNFLFGFLVSHVSTQNLDGFFESKCDKDFEDTSFLNIGQGSVVSVATYYGLGGLGTESQLAIVALHIKSPNA
jgi:hypothetical protein